MMQWFASVFCRGRPNMQSKQDLLQVILESKNPLGEMGSAENSYSNFVFPFAKSFWGSNSEFLAQDYWPSKIPAISHCYL